MSFKEGIYMVRGDEPSIYMVREDTNHGTRVVFREDTNQGAVRVLTNLTSHLHGSCPHEPLNQRVDKHYTLSYSKTHCRFTHYPYLT